MATSRHIPEVVDNFKNLPWIEVRASNANLKQYVMGNVGRFAKFVQRRKGPSGVGFNWNFECRRWYVSFSRIDLGYC